MPTISTGQVSGSERDGVAVFTGIPYAKSPFGPLRFAAPEPAGRWDGTFEATRFGPRPPQPTMLPGQPVWDPAAGLDVLTVNVWTPDPGGSGLPVMVWLYGGAYWMGSADWPEYDGTLLARDGVVVVTLNYRVGMEGFGQVPGAPANRGLLDQVAALRWVRDNIAAFGGDPGNVTVFGESAGAGSVACLMAMPSAAGLFRRAIAQSVPGVFLSPALAARVTDAIMARAGGGSPHDVPPELMVSAASEFAREELTGRHDRWGLLGSAAIPFAPVVDGEVLPELPWQALRGGAARDVELISGYNRDEYRTFHAMNGGRTVDLPGALERLAPPGAGAAYREAAPGGDEEAYLLLMSDWLFRMPSTLLAEAHRGPAWLYELTWAPTPFLGACHGLDVPLVFGTTDGEMAAMMIGDAPHRERMSEQFRTAWVRFAATGDPGWPRYEPGSATTHLFDVEPADVDDPQAVSRALWAGQAGGALLD
ncbi:carboxylesterase family protein [Nonomuraea sp. MCN248]|uniref:Carboxylic ester hydrolase n=1 Tax=Nonomuraea corallina TaxID=2989783 RepID=A0ABT4SBJ4_9ACTN|nr:carboxylesterase family protein [Nonomuraea corallina]MDA0634525.1 carboxylesterase family protein [Nonomuraea corallina]